MTDAELWAAWRIWMAVAAAVILVAAVLLIIIWLTARRIVAEARRALAAAEAIRDSTGAIRELQTTNAVAEDLLATVQAIEDKSRKLVESLQGHAAAGPRRRG